MSYQALARKYRPQTFEDIIGQETIVQTLHNAIEQNRVHHAYLFSGVRGVGKTTMARIFAKALNCVQGPTVTPCNECSTCREITEGIDLDVREIDAATYTQVDNIRELREVTQFQPARDRRRIFIIDEAHMLSTGAWNALLKLIEEPPPHVIFMMATTEMQKVPATILSRVQRFVFQRITPAQVADRLEAICAQEEIEAERAALDIIALRGEGSVRDSLSLLDQVVSFSGKNVSAASVSTLLGLSENRLFVRLLEQIIDGDHSAILEELSLAAQRGVDFKLLYRDFLFFLRTVVILTTGSAESLLALGPDELAMTRAVASRLDSTEALRIISLLMKDDELVSRSEHQRLAVEIALLKAATLPRLRSIEAILRDPKGTPAAPLRGSSNAAGKERQSSAADAPVPRAAAVRPDPIPRSEIPAVGEFGQQLKERVSDTRKMTGSYLAQAKEIARSGNRLRIVFDPSDLFAAEYLSDEEQRRHIEKVAGELAGEPLEVTIVKRAMDENKPVEQKNRIEDDPVVKSFARHLGGEVIGGK